MKRRSFLLSLAVALAGPRRARRGCVSNHPSARLKSGRAIQALQDQVPFRTSDYLDHVRCRIQYEGQLLNNLWP